MECRALGTVGTYEAVTRSRNIVLINVLVVLIREMSDWSEHKLQAGLDASGGCCADHLSECGTADVAVD